jgi:hypothetical protein
VLALAFSLALSLSISLFGLVSACVHILILHALFLLPALIEKTLWELVDADADAAADDDDDDDDAAKTKVASAEAP